MSKFKDYFFSEHKINSNANATIPCGEGNAILGTLTKEKFSYGITMRPNENKIVTLGKTRKQYGSFTLDQQKEILMNIISHSLLKGLKYLLVNFEIKPSSNKKFGDLMHFHSFLKFSEHSTYLALKEHGILLNSRYSPLAKDGKEQDYAFDYKILLNEVDEAKWYNYIHKDAKKNK